MKKILLTLIIIMASVSFGFAAGLKISELTETQTLTDDDLVLVSTYSGGAYTSQYIKKNYLVTSLGITNNAATMTVIDTTDATAYVALFDSATGNLAIKTDTKITFDATTGILTATGFAGPLTGNVTGNASTATALAADPADCSAGQVATGIAASGALTCTATPSVTTLTGDVTGTASGNIANTLADAAGDIIQASADNTWVKLSIGTAYQIPHVNSGATALAYTSTLGATGTRLTKGWFTDLEITNAPTINGAALTTILQPLDGELTALAGLTSAANAIPYFTGSATAGVISSSADMVALLASADYATARTNLGLAIGTDVQAQNADLETLSGGGSANCLWGEKSDSSGIECKTSINLQIDDSAAQFKSATASKGTLKFDQTGISDTKLVTVKYTAADSYAFTPTLLGNVSLSLGTTFTDGKYCTYSTANGFTCNADGVGGAGDCTGGDCLDGSSDGGTYIRLYDGTSAYTALTAAVRKFTISSSVADSEDLTITLGNNDNKVTVSSSTGVTEANFSALNLVTTGTVSGKIPMISKSGNYTLGTDNAQEAYGYMVWLTGDGTILTLPAVAAGMSVCVYSADSYDKVVNPNDNDGIRNGTTTRNADGHAITSGATDQGSFVCLVGDSADGWTVLRKAGTWTDE